MTRTAPTAADFTDNIRNWYAQATQEQIAEGRAWYPLARELAAAISERTGIELQQVCGVIASLSPQNKWARNLVDTAAYCEAAAAHSPNRPKACTFTPNQIKGWAIANGTPWESVLIGPKVNSFIANILGNHTRVTVDIWATRAATNGAINNPGSESRYRAIESAYQQVAAEVNESPAALQAIVWCVYRGTGA